ncbi:hypothetical protein F5H01DRAFT_418729 [Linnemannia elongata]|nr:hypothetical protein F5H01DRAFT_418843 [Linnemannia elongata]KAK5797012.1 hypothetical protein F5H01DRAFT_418729 [Linnemannia elongata]
MNDNHLTLFCLVDGEATSNAFPVEIESTKTIGHLKKLIKAEKAPRFDDVAADELTLWRVSIHDDDDNDLPVLLDSVPVKKKLRATNKLFMVFDADLPEDTIHVIVQRPLPAAKREREEDADNKERVSLLDFIGQAIDRTDTFYSMSSTALALQDTNMKNMDKLSAPRGILLPVVDTNDIYVREAYKDLYDTILGTFENNTPYTGNELKKHVIVTGKSAFLVYFAIRLLAESDNDNPPIIVFHTKRSAECYVFGGRSTVRSGNIEAFKPFLSLPDTWYFVDSTPDPVLGRAKTVISASPKTLFSEAHQYQDVDKRVAWRYYMAPWSLEELKKCRISVVGFEVVPLEAVEELYSKIGGVPRYVLERPMQNLSLRPNDLERAKVMACERLEQALDRVKDPVMLMQYFSQGRDTLDFSSRLIHRWPMDDHDTFRLEWASTYVAEKSGMLKKLVMDPNGSASGIMFEAYVLRTFREGGHIFELKDLETGQSARLEIPRNPEVTHFNTITPVTAGTLCIPKICNYACVDLLLAPRDLFQVTVSKNHPIKGLPLSKLIDNLIQARWILPHDEPRLIFVVPGHVYTDFEKQDYLTSEGKVYRTVPADIQHVRQYVLKIDLESAAGGKSPGLQIPVQQNAGTKGSTLEFLQRT